MSVCEGVKLLRHFLNAASITVRLYSLRVFRFYCSHVTGNVLGCFEPLDITINHYTELMVSSEIL